MTQKPAFDASRFLKSPAARVPDLAMSRIEANARIRFTVAQALAQGRVLFHYQPVVRADNPQVPAFFEALARLRLPNGQMLPAGGFLPAVGDTELGRAVDRLALVNALNMLEANPRLRLSVNMSPRSMGDEQWLAILAAAHGSGGAACQRLILEITEEAALADADQIMEFMDYVRRMGPAFALDDFGAGATGFRHFSRFRFDIVKLDGSYAQGVHANPDSQVLVECLVRLARHFEMFCIAERVETATDAAWMRQAGVDCLQGYLYGRPAAVPELPGAEATRRAAG
jgi:EAL domain-containing protein (putative c-di-GMP-specific phosphodiesterase class I)